ncbi:MAG: 3-5 exonuclease protein 2 [Burkholderiales bacterium]|nr:3-5 exonuclease protein 2 [Burkholderiales bacterium]
MVLPPELLRDVSRDEVNELPIRRYEGPVVLIETAPALEAAMMDLRAERVVGFDTETRPAFRVGVSYAPALAQLATARSVYLFPVQRLDFEPEIAELMASPRLVKTGVSVKDDLRQLQKLFSFEEKSIVDLGDVVRRHGLKQSGVRNLAGLFLGYRVPKGSKTSNWATPRLSAQQITYAATDAWVCRELYLKFETLGLL